jgi:hypothetical protein
MMRIPNRLLNRQLNRLLCVGAAGAALAAGQEATSGFSMPVTLAGGAMYTQRLQFSDPTGSAYTAGFRAMFYPTIRLGQNWFGYAAVQVRETPYVYYDAYDPNHQFNVDTLQAFIGYSVQRGQTAMVIKAGRLTSAFGSFPLRYDDAENFLLDQPLSYITDVPLRHDQLPCGTADLRAQFYGFVANSCGGTRGGGPGLVPATLYGLPGIEADFSISKLDARVQVTSGSPASPQSLTRAGQYAQWTAGGGYSIRQGFRIGVSGFRGPYLDQNLSALLPPGTTVRSYPASAAGIDTQWARGRWRLNAELQRFWFDSPKFTVSPSFTSGYVEAKSVITPRLYLSTRAGWLSTGRVSDTSGASASSFAPALSSYELGGGYWLGRNELIKASYEWLHLAGSSGTRTNVLGVEFVVKLNSPAWSF